MVAIVNFTPSKHQRCHNEYVTVLTTTIFKFTSPRVLGIKNKLLISTFVRLKIWFSLQ